MTAHVVIGQIGSAHGVRGWVKVISFTEPPQNILNYTPWQLRFTNKFEQVSIADMRPHGQHILIQFEGCTDRDIARRFTGAEIVITREQLPTLPPDEYYWTDLEGMQVFTLDGQLLGQVDHLLSTGANDVLVVTGNKRHLIPFLMAHTVISVDTINRKINVDWDPNF
jgi:16S rRNA processing protein RimM